MPARFESGKLRIRSDRMAVFEPLNWRRLDRVRVTIKGGPGGPRTWILRDRSRFTGSFAIEKLKVKAATGKGSLLVMRVLASGVCPRTRPPWPCSWQAGKRTVAGKAVALRHVGKGERTLKANVRLPNGRYRLTGYLTLTRPGAAPDSLTAPRWCGSGSVRNTAFAQQDAGERGSTTRGQPPIRGPSLLGGRSLGAGQSRSFPWKHHSSMRLQENFGRGGCLSLFLRPRSSGDRAQVS